MGGPVAAWFEDGRLHLQHGPIDLILEAFGAAAETDAAYRQAQTAFAPVLTDLVGELPALRQIVSEAYPLFRGSVARRMAKAVYHHRRYGVTPMAAVAGAVADHILAAMIVNRRLNRAYVNNGGDIALYLSPGTAFTAGVVQHPALNSLSGGMPIQAHIAAEDRIGGVATSGWRGRSHSLGIADAVTVLAPNAAAADATATLIANEVNVELPEICRQPASSLDPDSDLGARMVTVDVPPLSDNAVRSALLRGVNRAREFVAAGHIVGAVLLLQTQVEFVGQVGAIQNQAKAPK